MSEIFDIVTGIFLGLDIIIKIGFYYIFLKKLYSLRKIKKINYNQNINVLYDSAENLNNVNIENVKLNKFSAIFCSKFIINLVLGIIFISLALYGFISGENIFAPHKFFNSNIHQHILISIYLLLHGITWILSSLVLYKESTRLSSQSWLGLRGFWTVSFVFSLCKLYILIYFEVNYKEKSSVNLRILRYFIMIIDILLSCVLCYFSIFHPYDFNKEDLCDQKLLTREQNESQINLMKNDSFVEKYISESNLLSEESNLQYSMYRDCSSSIEFKLQNDSYYNVGVKITTQNYQDLTIKLKINRKDYKVKKSCSTFCYFNGMLLKYYKADNVEQKIVSLVQQAYNFSLTLDPKRPGFNENKETLNSLSFLYGEIIKQYNKFLLDLLTFLKLKKLEVYHNLLMSYNNNYEEFINKCCEEEDDNLTELKSIPEYNDSPFNNNFNSEFDSENDNKNKTKNSKKSDLLINSSSSKEGTNLASSGLIKSPNLIYNNNNVNSQNINNNNININININYNLNNKDIIKNAILDPQNINKNNRSDSMDNSNASIKRYISKLDDSVYSNNSLIKHSHTSKEFESNKAKLNYSRDLIKKFYFFNDILINKRYIEFKLINIDLLEKKVYALLKIKKADNNISIEMNINSLIKVLYKEDLKSEFLLYLEKLQNNNIIDINDNNSNNELIKEYKLHKELLDNLFTIFLNNLYYYDEDIFDVFQLDKILKLDIIKYDNSALSLFFKFNDCIIDSNRDIRNFKYDIIIKDFANKKEYDTVVNYIIKTRNKSSDKAGEISGNFDLISLYLIICDFLNEKNIPNLPQNFKDIYEFLSEFKNTLFLIFNIIFMSIKTDDFKSLTKDINEGTNNFNGNIIVGFDKINLYVQKFKLKDKNNINQIKYNNKKEVSKLFKVIETNINLILNDKDYQYILSCTNFRDCLNFYDIYQE